ncbi:hypothetical protein [Streptomyces oceani]|uniref:MarR family transcriptional regulator n=1 Tax=Streptomyces oceani TaxID=1075402 RepID=A0A1E7KFF3_9ACTN|nr:hypothetical protein [Streptomyces oceani]OEV02636.1 hypothetical protein AN216_14095 [Streptomyces oceani]
MTEQADQPPPAASLTEKERAFVHKVAEHYRRIDNMAWNTGYVFGYMMICDPAEQRVSQIVEALGVTAGDVDHAAKLLATPGVFEKHEEPGGDDYRLVLPEHNWPKAVRHSLVHMPKFHQVLQRGLEVLDGASEERRERLVRLEHLYSHLATEVPAVFDRFEKAAE